ncbi:MAG: peptidoglycan DD-metalloendopeptidase family protein [Endomicrobium sp.]|jgi:septal ring factor EnvC (AmiA/AmiB activator)|nr:peptidoglycan DD-metalloendopeptidase family protein [Endomicrobium sp.]
MKKKIITTVFLLFLSFIQVFTYAEDVRLKSRQQLLEIKKSIKNKEQEKNKLILQERIVKRELKSVNDGIRRTEKKLKKCLLDIETAQKSLEKFSKIYNFTLSKSSDLSKAILTEMRLFNKMTFIFLYEQNPIEYKLHQKSLEYKKVNFESVKKEIAISAQNIKKWEKSKKYFLNLQQRENKFVNKHKSIVKEKNELLKTTLYKRFATEQEIKVLNNNARALESLINKINEKNKQNITARGSINRVKRKKSLPWPVEGKVILNFGKNKHSELNTYIISNGIKIATTDFSSVKAVDAGVVVFTGHFRSYGKVIIIDHKNSVFSVYGFLNRIFVKEEQKVLKNFIIAELGSGKNSVLYFEISENDVPDNPILWLQEK